MNKPTIPFSVLRQLLLDLDFTEVVVPRSHIGFHHAESGAEIMLPNYKSNQIVAPRHLLMVRIMLDGKGLLDGERFDEFVASGTAKLSAS
jgi:hypothetical protein